MMYRALLLTGLMTIGAAGQNTDPKKDPDQIGNRDVSKGVNFYSIPKELALGKQLADQVKRQAPMVKDPIIAELVNRLGQNLARNSDSKIPVNIAVIESNEINSLTLPGGYIFVFTGLLRTAATESELAGAMAHEIAHVAARHGTRQATQNQIINLSSIPLIFMGGWAGYGARQASPLGDHLLAQGFSREFESEADMLGLQYLYKTGYDPGGMIDIFEKIEAHEAGNPNVFQRIASSHPPTGDRLTAVQKDIQEHLKAQPEYVVSTSDFAKMKARLAALDEERKAKLKQAPSLYRKLS